MNGDFFRKLLSKRIRITGTTLRARSVEVTFTFAKILYTLGILGFGQSSQIPIRLSLYCYLKEHYRIGIVHLICNGPKFWKRFI